MSFISDPLAQVHMKVKTSHSHIVFVAIREMPVLRYTAGFNLMPFELFYKLSLKKEEEATLKENNNSAVFVSVFVSV